MDLSFVEVLQTYKQVRMIVEAFAKRNGLNFVILIARPGVGKTNTFYGEMCQDAHLIEGGLSPVKLYCRLFDHRDKPVVFDDVDTLFNKDEGVNLLKQLGQTDSVKRLSWDKASPVLKEEGVPTTFKTKSRMMIFANKLTTIEENMGAVLDRAFLYRFDPPSTEVHREVKRWFKDQEILGFVDRHLASITVLSMRHYTKAAEQKRAGLDWQRFLINAWQVDPKLDFAMKLLREDIPPAERQKRFEERGLGAVATFKRYMAQANRQLKAQAGIVAQAAA